MSGSDDVPAGPPEGAQQVWGNISTLVAGPIAWGGIGYGVDALTNSSAFLPAGVVFGFLASLVWVLWRFAHPVAATPDRRDAPGQGERR